MLKLTGLLGLAVTLLATEPDAATRNWWRHVEFLANDGMKGRDTGTPEYRKAAEYVAAQFERAGLKPAGDQGYFQSVPMHRYKVDAAQTSFELVDATGKTQPLELYRQIAPTAGPTTPPEISGELIFAGDAKTANVKGKIVVQIGRGTQPGAEGVISIDATGGPEPPRWPVAYFRHRSPAGFRTNIRCRARSFSLQPRRRRTPLPRLRPYL